MVTRVLGLDVDGCQDNGPFLGLLKARCHIVLGIPKGTIILTTTHVGFMEHAKCTYEVNGKYCLEKCPLQDLEE